MSVVEFVPWPGALVVLSGGALCADMRADLLRLLLVVVAGGLASLGGVGILVTGIERGGGHGEGGG